MPRRPVIARSDLALLMPLGLVAWFVARGHTGRAIAVGVLLVIAVAARLVLGPRFPAAMERLGHGAARVLTGMVTVGLWALVVLPTWVLRTAFLRPEHSARSRPEPSARSGSEPSHPEPSPRSRREGAARRPFTGPTSGRGRLRVGRVLAAVAVVAIVAAGVAHQVREQRRESTFWAAAAEGQPHGPELLAEQEEMNGWVSDPRLGFRVADEDLRFINVRDEVRRTWVPEGEIDATVWWFGGSGAFGLGQRDLHTIPSYLAREAAADGLDLRIENRGVSGYVAWQEAGLFEELIEAGQEPPAVAVFYHRSNDLALACRRIEQGLDPDRAMVLPARIHIEDLAPPATVRAPRPCGGHTEEAGLSLARELQRAMDEARRLGEEHGVQVVEVWQPDIWTLRADAGSASTLAHVLPKPITPDSRSWAEEIIATAREATTPAPIDMGGALDGAGRVVMFDDIHHNEAGARLVAARLWPRLAPSFAPADD